MALQLLGLMALNLIQNNYTYSKNKKKEKRKKIGNIVEWGRLIAHPETIEKKKRRKTWETLSKLSK